MAERGQRENHEVIAVRLVQKAAPVILAISAKAFAEFRVGVAPLRERGSDADKNKGGIIEAVERCDPEASLGVGGGGIAPALTAR
jgi:hypothetical protein